MQILCVDIGTGTQDIFLYNSRLDIENGYKLVLPSPTTIINRQIQRATGSQRPILLCGKLMGGGPNAWAAEAHLRAKLPIYATPEAALSFNDELEAVRDMGITIVSDDEALSLPKTVDRIEMRDFDFERIAQAFALFGVSLNNLAAIGVAVFDHGNSPPGYSDRQFRFDYLNQRIRQSNSLGGFAFCSQDIPGFMTRMQSIARCAEGIDAPLVVMDTAPAAVWGASFDPVLHQRPLILANIGNMHTLAFRLGENGIEGLFEHHTGLLTQASLEQLLISLVTGSLTHADVFNHHGHGALMLNPTPLSLKTTRVGICGPRRSLLSGSSLTPHSAAPFGDMMIAGCFGLLAAVGEKLSWLCDEVFGSLSGRPQGAPWDLTPED